MRLTARDSSRRSERDALARVAAVRAARDALGVVLRLDLSPAERAALGSIRERVEARLDALTAALG